MTRSQVLSGPDIRDELACAGREASLGFDAIVGLYGRFSGVSPPAWTISPLRRFETRHVVPNDDVTVRQIGELDSAPGPGERGHLHCVFGYTCRRGPKAPSHNDCPALTVITEYQRTTDRRRPFCGHALGPDVCLALTTRVHRVRLPAGASSPEGRAAGGWSPSRRQPDSAGSTAPQGR